MRLKEQRKLTLVEHLISEAAAMLVVYHYLYFMYIIGQPCEVLALPFTDMECESSVVQVTCRDYAFSLWSSWDSHTALFNSKIHGLFTTSGRFKIFMWLELLDKIQDGQLNLNFR